MDDLQPDFLERLMEFFGDYWPIAVAVMTGAFLFTLVFIAPDRYKMFPRELRTNATHYKPKAHLLTLLSVIWLAISGIPLLALWLDPQMCISRFRDFSSGLLLMVLPHPIFIVLAIYFWITERPRELPKTIY